MRYLIVARLSGGKPKRIGRPPALPIEGGVQTVRKSKKNGVKLGEMKAEKTAKQRPKAIERETCHLPPKPSRLQVRKTYARADSTRATRVRQSIENIGTYFHEY